MLSCLSPQLLNRRLPAEISEISRVIVAWRAWLKVNERSCSMSDALSVAFHGHHARRVFRCGGFQK